MANHKSAIKRHKQSQKRNELNKAAKTKVRNVVKSVRAAIQSNDQAAAAAALVRANSTLDKIAGAGVIHWKKAARKISRLSRAVNGMQA